MPIGKRIPATCASSGQSKRFLATLVLAHAPVQKNCMTLHDAEARPNLHFLSSPATLGESQKSLVFPRTLPMETGLWLGPESNRRHVDFQSTALPTELPSRQLHRGVPTMPQCGCRATPKLSGLPYKNSSNLDDATRAQRDQQRNELRQSFSAAHMIP